MYQQNVTTQDRSLFYLFFPWKNVHNASCCERGILFLHGNKQVLTSHGLWAACVWNSPPAEVSLLIQYICYHSEGCSEESNNSSKGPKFTLEQVFSQGSVHYDFVSGSWCSASQHNYVFSQMKLDIHSSHHLAFS